MPNYGSSGGGRSRGPRRTTRRASSTGRGVSASQRVKANRRNNPTLANNPQFRRRTVNDARNMGNNNPSLIPSNYKPINKVSTIAGVSKREQYYCPPGTNTITNECRKLTSDAQQYPIAHTSNIRSGARRGRPTRQVRRFSPNRSSRMRRGRR